MEPLERAVVSQLDFEKRGGLLPVVVQHVNTREVIMVAYANRQAVEETIKYRMAVFWSTSRKEIWYKGRESGDTISVKQILVDCDGDALVYIARPAAGVCHTTDEDGATRKSCFYREIPLR